MIGQVVGSYKIVEKIGEGGMGAVYRGIDLMLEREVALKALRPELASQPQVVERFRSEAVTLAKLNHPNIATLYSFFRQGNDYFMVLEFVRGATLDSVIGGGRPLPPAQALALFGQALEGIDHAHRYGIVHRDIKPGNMMLTPDGTLKVLDFGIARVLGSARMTRAGHLIGTVEYMSPEQVRGQETDARSDIYSLGLLLYEMLTGRVPFSTDSEFDLMRAQVEERPQPPRVFAAHIPDAVEDAIMRALEKRPEDRFQTAAEFRAALAVAGVAPAQTVGVGTSAAQSFPPSHAAEQLPPTGAGAAPRASEETAKETRLAPPAAAPQPAPQPGAPNAKETRLAPSDFVARAAGATAGENAHAATGESAHAATDPFAAPAATQPMFPSPPAAQGAAGGALPFGLSVKLLGVVAGAGLLVLAVGALVLWTIISGRRAEQQAAAEAEAKARAAQTAATPTPTPADPAPPEGMVYVRGGEFMMGRDDGDEYERPAHQVTVAPFFIDKYEVTNEEYEKFVSEKNHPPPPTWKGGKYPEGHGRRPVTGVNWEDARAYAEWKGRRLPTEAEWEFAARGADGYRYPWGNEWRDGMANADSANKGMVDVGQYQGASPFGALDMIGNAWEWTADDLTAYPGGALSVSPQSGTKVLRGGSWESDRDSAITTYRMGWPASKARDGYTNTGLRCVQDIRLSN